jgi:hypothetical protein
LLWISFVLSVANQDNTSPISGIFHLHALGKWMSPVTISVSLPIQQTEPVMFDLLKPRWHAGLMIPMGPGRMTPLSIYVLTFNSEKYLSAILQAVAPLADDLLVVDSGSSDQTVAIATQCGARVLYRPFDDFRQQRDFAQQQCRHDHVFFLDSDEIPSPELVAHLQQLKQSGFQHDAYAIQRDWIVMGQQVHALYPVGCPDYPVRIIEKTGFAVRAGGA